MANQIRLKRASGSDPSASDLVTGELAVRTDTAKLFTKKDDNSVAEIGVTDLVDDTSPQLGGDLQTNGNNISFSDDDELRFGAGNDLILEHNGTRNIIKTMNGDINIRYSAQEMIVAKPSEAVELYYNNVKTFHTKQNGVVVEGTEGAGAILEIRADEGDNNADFFRFFADPSTSNLYVQNYASGSWETNARFIGNGTTELWYDNSKKFETTSAGVEVFGKIVADELSLETATSGSQNTLQLKNSNASAGTNEITFNSTTSGSAFDAASIRNGVPNTGNGSLQFKTNNGSGLQTAVVINNDQTTDFNAAIDVTGNITVSGTVDGRDVASDGSKLDGIASGATNVTNTNQLTNGAGFITSADGGNAATLDSLDSTAFLRSNADDSGSGLLSLSSGVAFGADAKCTAAVSSLSDGSTITVNFTSGIHHSVTLGGNRTFGNPSNDANAVGQSGSIFITQDGTGSRTASFHSDYKFVGGTAPTLSTAANAVDRLDYVIKASGVIHCVVSLDVK